MSVKIAAGDFDQSTNVRQPQELLEVLKQPARIVAGIVAHDEIAERIDDEQGVLAPLGRKAREQCARWRCTGIENLKSAVLVREKVAIAAGTHHEEHALDTRHVAVERKARL